MQETLLNYYNKNKYSWPGLAALNAFIFILLITIFDPFLIKGVDNFYIRLIIYIFIIIVTSIIWFYKTQILPSNTKNKLGIVICIDAENERERTLIKNDLIQQIIELLAKHGFNNDFETILLPDHLARRYLNIINEEGNRLSYYNANIVDTSISSSKSWLKLKNKTRGVFYIHGVFKTRKSISDKYLLQINSIVLHKEIAKEKSLQLSNEMRAIIPREISFNLDQEINGITVTATTLYIATRYIMGIASLVSANYALAISLFNNLSSEINSKLQFTDAPNINHVQKNADYYLSEALTRFSSEKYEQGLNDEAIKLNNRAIEVNPKNYNSHILQSIYYFVINKDIIQSIQSTYSAQKCSVNEYTWLYNRAFLLMYSNKYEKAYKCYKRLMQKTFPNEELIVNQCINFNQGMIKVETNKYQCLFILGYLYYFKKSNYPMALEYFEEFLLKVNNDHHYTYLKVRADTFRDELKQYMNIT